MTFLGPIHTNKHGQKHVPPPLSEIIMTFLGPIYQIYVARVCE